MLNITEKQLLLLRMIKDCGIEVVSLLHTITSTCIIKEEILKITIIRLKNINLDYLQLKIELTKMRNYAFETIIKELESMESDYAKKLLPLVVKFKNIRNIFLHGGALWAISKKNNSVDDLVQKFFTLDYEITKITENINTSIYDTMSDEDFIFQHIQELFAEEIKELMA